MVRGIQRLIDDIRNPKASKKRRKKKIDDLPDLPFFPKFKAPPITKAAKELAKILIDIGPEAGKPRFFEPEHDYTKPTTITRHTQEQLDYEANLVRWKPTTPLPNAKPIRGPPQEMTRVTIEDDMREIFDNVDDLAAQEIAEEIYQVAEQTQNQDMEDALARIERRRPRQFRSNGRSRQFSRANLVRAPKKKRKVSAYSKRFGVELKKLKKLHPRTKIQNLMKKAHRRTRAAMKKK